MTSMTSLINTTHALNVTDVVTHAVNVTDVVNVTNAVNLSDDLNVTGAPNVTEVANVTEAVNVTRAVNVTQPTLPNGEPGVDQISYLSALGVMLFIGVVGNSSVILGVLADRSLRTPTFVVIGSLALADMLFVGLRIPIEMFFMITSSNWPYGALSCKFLTYGRMVPAYAASYHLVLLALVRYYLLSRPLKSIHTLTVRRTAFASLALWVFFLAALSPLLVFTEVQSASGVHTCTIVCVGTCWVLR
ncbi:hypothetical protein BaRGS_00021323 [Batillaria attramentaria]|uniref:G-protein coupled receptors family 1 profile domain-containing protein n=1 Tax=Batillaria attramentaria TaxID=370345 RepID=A0ABD0KKI4_9CAEN